MLGMAFSDSGDLMNSAAYYNSIPTT